MNIYTYISGDKLNYMEPNNNSIKLRQQIVQYFDVNELQSLCEDVGIDHENLVGSRFTKTELAKSLINYLVRRNRLQELILACQKVRPDVVWIEDEHIITDVLKPDQFIKNSHITNSIQNYMDRRIEDNIVEIREIQGAIELNPDKKLNWDSLQNLWQKIFGGDLLKVKESEESVVFKWIEPNLEKLVKYGEQGKLDEQVRTCGGNLVTEILNPNFECIYQFVPNIDFTSNTPIEAVGKTQMQEASAGIDILILTVTHEERQVVLTKMKPLPGYRSILLGSISKTTYRFGQFGKYRCAHVESVVGTVNRGSVTTTAMTALAEIKPKAFLLLGIAFGVDRKNQRLGDVIIAETVQPYEYQRIGKLKVIPRGTEMQCNIILSERFRTRRNNWKIIYGNRKVNVFQGQMLSGEKLIDNKEFRDKLVVQYPTAKGGEMEGHGAYAAGEQSGVPTILVKSICDWADGHKDDRAHVFAASTAVSLAEYVLNQPDVLAELGTIDVEEKALSKLTEQNGITESNWGEENSANQLTQKVNIMEAAQISSQRRFRVALSFSGNERAYVSEVASYLARHFGKDKVFYDANYRAELARINLDTYLQNIYYKEADIIALFFSDSYKTKTWCGLEWRAIRNLITERPDSIIPIKFDSDNLPDGLFPTDGYVPANQFTAREVAEVIIERYGQEFRHSRIAAPLETRRAAPQIRRKLETKEKRLLAQALLACPSMARPDNREAVLAQLPKNISNSITRNLATNVDVYNIVDACSNYDGGIIELVEAVRTFDEGVIPMQQLDKLVEELQLNPD